MTSRPEKKRAKRAPRKPAPHQPVVRKLGARQPPPSAAQELKGALERLHERQAERKRKGKKKWKPKQRHIDDYWELCLDRTRTDGFADALLDVTASSYVARKRLLADEAPRVELPDRARGAPSTPEQAQQEAARAAEQVKRRRDKKGAPAQEHYYPARERSETGEIDRTYQVDRRKRH